MKKFGLIFFFIFLLLITGCEWNNSSNELVKAQEKVDKANLKFNIPKLDGYEVNYVQHTFPPKDQGNVIGDHQEVLVTYTKNKGKPKRLAKEQQVTDEREILYGPYQGDTSIEITYSNSQSELVNSEMTEMDEKQVQKAKVGEHTFLLFNSKNGSVQINYNNLDEATAARITQQIINSTMV